MTEILVFIPGLLGSELHDDQGKIWPGSLLDGALGFNDAQFKRLMEPNLKAPKIVEWAGGVVNIYGRWMDTFRSIRKMGDPLFSDDNADGPTLYTVPYDWRISLETSAKDKLAPVIQRIAAKHGAGATIHLVAHSLGGLVARYYLQSGKFDADAGFNSIKTFTTFGTPHNGAPVAVAAALGLHKTNFLSLAQAKRLANHPDYPALYQLFPICKA
jgi:phospholipase A1